MSILKVVDCKFPYISFIVPVILLLLSSCAPVEITKPVIENQVQPEVSNIKVYVDKPKLNVAILLSSSAKSFKNTATMLAGKLNKNSKEYILTGDKKKDAELIRNIQSGSYSHVVSLGLKAAKATDLLKSKIIIFSHIFNHKKHQLINSKRKGVSVLPVPDQLFKDWKALSPGLSSVVLVTGDDFEFYVDYAKKIAKQNGVELIHRIAKSDKEFIYIIKRLPLYVQGHWVLPDSRILSRTAIKEVMSYNSKKGKQSIVFSKGLLSLGGLFYVKASDKEVVSMIMKRLNNSLGKKVIPGEDILLPKKHDIGINKKVADQLGLAIPEYYRKFVRD